MRNRDNIRHYERNEVLGVRVVDAEETGKNIRKLITDSGIRVIELREMLNLTTCNAIYKWMNGTVMPSVDNLVLLTEILDVSIDDIIKVKYV